MGINKPRSDADTTTLAGDQPFETFAVDVTSAGAKPEPLLTSEDVPNPLQPFLYFISSSEYHLIRGVYLPRPRRIFIIPGLGFVGKKGELSNMLLYQEGLGRMMVPPQTQVTAWGQTVNGYVRPWKMKGGRKHYTTVWQSWKRVGQAAVWDKDSDGWFEFCQTCHAMLGGGDVPQTIQDRATASIIAELEYLSKQPPYNAVAQTRKALLQGLLPMGHPLSTRKPEKGATTANTPKKRGRRS